jgi:hypothetical protein
VTQRFDVIDIPELALRNLAAQLPEAADGLILLWLNAQSAQLLVIKQSTLYLARTVQFTSQNKGSNTVRRGSGRRRDRARAAALDRLLRKPLRANADQSSGHRAA